MPDRQRTQETVGDAARAPPALPVRPRRWTVLVLALGATALVTASQLALSLDGARQALERAHAALRGRASSPLEEGRHRTAPAGDDRAGPPARRPATPPRVGPAIVLAAWPGPGPEEDAPPSPEHEDGAPTAGTTARPSEDGGALPASPARGDDAAPEASGGPEDGGGTEDDAAPGIPRAAQLVHLQAGYDAADRGEDDVARREYAAAAAGPDERTAQRARTELREAWLQEGYDLKARGDRRGSAAAFQAAGRLGADPQTVEAELGYLAVQDGRVAEARRHLRSAASGADAEVAGDARDALIGLPRRSSTEVYAEGFGWRRLAGAEQGRTFVPSMQLRLRFRPLLERDVHLYVAINLSRDLGQARPVGAVPPSYADGLVVAGGVLVRGWEQRLTAYAQAGTATHLTRAPPGETAGTRLDLRAGATLELENEGCWPLPAHGVELRWRPCADGWGEATALHRDGDDVGAFLRARLGGAILLTGPVAWGVVAEGRAAVDRRSALYGEFADAGVGLRAKLLAPLHVDLLAVVSRGRALGLVRPAPEPATYTDLRLLIATSFER